MPDCSDMSDEMNCTCDDKSFVCESGQCIKAEFYCDGLPQCRDGSDERNCTALPQCNDTSSFLCDNERCIPGKASIYPLKYIYCLKLF